MNRKSCFFFACLLLLKTVSAQSPSYVWKSVRKGDYTYKTVSDDPMHTRFYTLKNGFTVILSVNKREPKIQCLLGVRAGSNDDPRNHTGLAHYLEHLMFKGTNKYGTLDWVKEQPYLQTIDSLYEVYNHTTDTAIRARLYRKIDQVSGEAAHYAIANEYDKMLSGMGAQGTNAMTYFDYTGYVDMIPSNAVDKYLAIQSERFRYPVFRLFHTELEAVYEEKNMHLDSDPEKVFERLYASLFPLSNYGRQTTIGTVEDLKNPSLKAIRTFYQEHYVPNNMALIMAGDLDPDALIKKIDAAFHYMQPRSVEVYHAPAEKPLIAPVYKEVLGPDAESVTIGFRLPGETDHAATVKAIALQALLYNDKAGLIDLYLNKQQTVLNADAWLDAFRDYTVLSLSGKPKADESLETVRDALLAQLDKIRKGDFDSTLLQAIVANYERSRIQSLENNRTRADMLFDAFVVDKGISWDKQTALLDELKKLTRQDIIDFAKQYLGNNYVCVYKRTGEDKNVVKVVKPPITPVEVNRSAQSPFLQKIASMPVTSVRPQWLNYKKDLARASLGASRLLYVQNKENDLFILRYRMQVGSYQSKLLNIAAQYLQYIGTSSMSSDTISRRFYNLACDYSIQVEGEYTTLSLTGLQENMQPAATLLEALLLNCQVNDTAWTSLKERILKARADSKMDKRTLLHAMSAYAIYGPENPFNYQLTNEELDTLKPATLVALLHSLLKYEDVVTYYGPASLQQAKAAIASVHQSPLVVQVFPVNHPFEKITPQQNTVLFLDYDAVQAQVEWIRSTDPFDTTDEPVIEVYNEYYGGNMSSVVFQTLRESKALAYSTHAAYYAPAKRDDKYVMLGYIGCQADKLNEAIAGMNALLDTVARSEEGLKLAKRVIHEAYQSQRYIGQEIIDQYLSDRRLGLDHSIRSWVYSRINTIGFDALQQFADANIAHKPFTYCVLASAKRIHPEDLEKYGTVKMVSLKELFGY